MPVNTTSTPISSAPATPSISTSHLPAAGASTPSATGGTPLATRLPLSCDPPTSLPAKKLSWLVYGATGHLGRVICRIALARGDRVTAVGRNLGGEIEALQGWGGECLGLVCDVRLASSVRKVVEKAKERWGRIDVVVNCTGYGIIGSCEDQDEDDIRGQFATNVMGTVNIIQTALPILKAQREGRFIIFSSIAGALGMPGLGPYSATKWAVEGLAESLMYEVEELGIKVTLVQPGLSRRDEPDDLPDQQSQESHHTDPIPGHQPPTPANQAPFWGHFVLKHGSEAYRDITSPSLHAIRMIDWVKYRQPTSAGRIAETVWELAHCGDPPFRLLLGSHAVDTIRDRLKFTIEDIEEWKYLLSQNVLSGGDSMEGQVGTGTATPRSIDVVVTTGA